MRKSLLAATLLCGGAGLYYAARSPAPEQAEQLEVESDGEPVARRASSDESPALTERASSRDEARTAATPPAPASALAEDDEESDLQDVVPAAAGGAGPGDPVVTPEEAEKAFAETTAKAATPEQMRAIKQEKLKTRARAYDRIIDQGRPDPAWEGEVSTKLASGLRHLFKDNAKVLDATCTNELCRIQIGYANIETGAHLMELLPAARSLLQAPAMMLAEGGDELTMYMPKSGQELPAFSADSIALANETAAREGLTTPRQKENP